LQTLHFQAIVMSTEMKCPKCRSTNIHITEKGVSLAKTVGGLVVAGPVGALAGLHGKNNLRATCLACGKIFYPVTLLKEAEQAKARESYREATKEIEWRRSFLYNYETSRIEEATEILRVNWPVMLEAKGVDETYRQMKRVDNENKKFILILIIVLLAAFTFLVYLFAG
jgi:hypothetical protein